MTTPSPERDESDDLITQMCEAYYGPKCKVTIPMRAPMRAAALVMLARMRLTEVGPDTLHALPDYDGAVAGFDVFEVYVDAFARAEGLEDKT